MTDRTPSLFARPDTLLGVCEGLGQDFGFDPLYLRIAFALAVFWSPVGAFATYLGLGIAVLAARLLFPVKSPVEPATATDRAASNDDDHASEAIAA